MPWAEAGAIVALLEGHRAAFSPRDSFTFLLTPQISDPQYISGKLLLGPWGIIYLDGTCNSKTKRSLILCHNNYWYFGALDSGPPGQLFDMSMLQDTGFFLYLCVAFFFYSFASLVAHSNMLFIRD